MSAPASSATSSASGVDRPQILTISDIAGIGSARSSAIRSRRSTSPRGFVLQAPAPTGSRRRPNCSRSARSAPRRAAGAERRGRLSASISLRKLARPRARAGARVRRHLRLPQPGGDAADHDADDQQHEDQHEQRQRQPQQPDAPTLNGSNDTVTICRLATANAMMTIGRAATRNAAPRRSCGSWRISGTAASRAGVDALGQEPVRRRPVEPLAHFLAGLEERHAISGRPRHARRCADCGRCAPAGA